MRESWAGRSTLHSHKTHSLPALPLAARGPAARAGGRGTPGGDRERRAKKRRKNARVRACAAATCRKSLPDRRHRSPCGPESRSRAAGQIRGAPAAWMAARWERSASAAARGSAVRSPRGRKRRSPHSLARLGAGRLRGGPSTPLAGRRRARPPPARPPPPQPRAPPPHIAASSRSCDSAPPPDPVRTSSSSAAPTRRRRTAEG
mmetsp:Transcript_29945/g.98196  ORF Transcript_29945/g.98196 Transcript_29945/m.98196 type:complete len:204 (-) Transcript_29945:446-1057(-)